MSFIYFVVISISVLIGYYVWAIFFNNTSKKITLLEDVEDQTIEFSFDEPIKVSKEFIFNSKEEKIRTDADTEQQTPTEKGTPIPIQVSQEVRAELEAFSGYNTYPSKLQEAVKRGEQVLSSILEYVPMALQPQAEAEVEYITTFSIDLDKSAHEGRLMFAKIRNI